MSKNLQIITKEHKLFGEVRFAIVDDKEYAVGIDIASALGYANPSKTISTKCKGVTKMVIPTSGGNQKTSLIPESDIYRLIFGSKLESAEKFQDWVFDEVLPSIRKHGAYISENADEEYVNNELRFGNKTTIKTFANADPANVNKLYEEFKTYIDAEYKNDTDTRKARYTSVTKGLNRLLDNIGTNVNNIGTCYNIQVLNNKVLSDIKTLNNRVNGGKKAGLTRENKKLQSQLEEKENKIKYLNPPKSDYLELDYHLFSNNYMYSYTTNSGEQIRTKSYETWRNNFPKQQVKEYFKDVDFTKTIEMFVKAVAVQKFDVQNAEKSLIDMVYESVTDIFDFSGEKDDRLVGEFKIGRVGTCNEYKKGKIFIFIRNI